MDNAAYQTKLNSAINAFYQSHWDKCRHLLKQLQEKSPNDIRPYFFDAMIPFWKYFFGGNQNKTANEFYQKSEKAIKVGLKNLKYQNSDTSVVLMLSGLYGYRSLVAANEKSYKIALQSGLHGFSYTRTLLMMNDDNPDALIGKGIFHYMIGSIPVELRWMTNIIGFSGNVSLGLSELKKAAESGGYSSTDAKMILCYLYNRSKNYQEALHYVKVLVDRYGDNIIFRYYYALELDKCGKKEEAASQYQYVIGHKNPDLSDLVVESQRNLKAILNR